MHSCRVKSRARLSPICRSNRQPPSSTITPFHIRTRSANESRIGQENRSLPTPAMAARCGWGAHTRTSASETRPSVGWRVSGPVGIPCRELIHSSCVCKVRLGPNARAAARARWAVSRNRSAAAEDNDSDMPSRTERIPFDGRSGSWSCEPRPERAAGRRGALPRVGARVSPEMHARPAAEVART
jgi:hypothetical protein